MQTNCVIERDLELEEEVDTSVHFWSPVVYTTVVRSKQVGKAHAWGEGETPV